MNGITIPPLAFIFARIFECHVEWQTEETDEYIEELEADWLAFWATKGKEIVNSSWSHTYSEYLLKEEEQEQQENSNNLSTEENHLQAETDCPLWQELWDEHYTEVYNSSYRLFQAVHYRHFCFYRSDAEKIIEESISEREEEELKFIDETEQLQALGLPTSFGGKNNKHNNFRLHDRDSDEKEDMPSSRKETLVPKKPQKKDRKQLPKVIQENKSLLGYWYKRFSLFTRFDAGIQLDRESWFSVTPEKVAIHMAERLRCGTMIDAFCGSGGNAIQFARTCSKVIAIDIDPEKIMNAKHNAMIYGVAHKIDFIIGDYLQLSGSLKGDIVFLSPPWGGPKYISRKDYDIEESLTPLGATALAEKSKQITENMAFFLPRNSRTDQIVKLAGIGNRVEIEHNYLDTRLIGLTAIYGDWLVNKRNLSD